MAEGEQSPRPNSLKPQEVQQLGDEAVEKMRRRVESRLALDIPQEPTLPMPVAGEDVHARTGSPQVPELSEPVSQDDQSGQILGGRRRARKGVKNVPQASEPVVASAVPVDGPDEEATGTKWWLKEIAAEGQLTPDPKVEAKVEPVAAVAADNPSEAAEIERLVEEAAAVEATIAQESLGDPIVADAQAPGEVAPRRRAVNVAEAPKSASAPLPVSEVTTAPKVQQRDKEGEIPKVPERERKKFFFEAAELSLASPSHPESNQDRTLNVPELGLFGVFDGVGGEEGGEKASSMAMERVGDFIRQYGRSPRSLEEAQDILRQAILTAHTSIRKAQDVDPNLQGMATTATVGWMFEGKLLIASVGDSRLYRSREGKLEQLSRDDSAIPEELRAKFNNVVDPQTELTPEELEIWKSRNKITNALGSEYFEDPTIEVFDVAEGDQYLFTSDGLTDPITDNELEKALASGESKTSLDLLSEAAERARQGGVEKLAEEGKGIENNSRKKADDVSFVLVGVKNKGEQPEDKAAPEVPKEIPKVETPADSLQQKIDALKIEVAEFRYKYAEMDYEKTSAWKTLKGFFRNITPGQEDADTQYWNREYTSKLMALQNLELEQVKQEGLKGEALKERMAGVIQYYKYEQATALYNDRTQVRMERQSFIGKAWGKWEQAVKAYGTLSLSKKVLIGVGLAGLSVATGGVGAAGILILRRMMGATGVAMATDAAFAALLDKKEQRKAKKEIEDFEKKFFFSDDLEQTFQNYSGFLSDEIFELNQKLQKKKRNALYRKGISLGIGVGLVLGGSVLASQASGMMHHESAATSTESASAPAAASAPEQASSAPARTEVPAATQETPSASPADIQGFKVEFERYQVTDADGKRGLWGILEQHLPEDMLPQAEKNRIIQSLENAIQQKLDHMSPAELKAVGFPTGNINTIYAGTQIDLGKLLTPDEVQAVMEGKNVTLSHVEAPSHVGGERLASSPVPDTAPSAAPQEAVSGQAMAPQPSSVKPAPVLDTHRSETLVQKNIPVTDPLTYLREHPEALGRYNSTLGRLRMGIFMMNPGEAGVPMEYDYTLNGEKLGSTQISQVLKDLKGFDRGFLQNLDYDRVKNPLHYDQMRELGKFIEASGKAFGPKLASVEAGESIDHYTRRMAMVALQTGKEIKGFYKP